MQILTGKLFKEMVLCGANTLHNNHPEIDALNVFPVPDGDTGTNMSMTFNAGAAEIKDMDSDNIYDIAKKLSKGLLMGARGNSGVILSQIFRGFAMGLEGHESVDAVAFANAWKSGAEVAYKAVMRPVEGTILTVIREASEKIVEYTQPGMEIEDVFSYFVKFSTSNFHVQKKPLQRRSLFLHKHIPCSDITDSVFKDSLSAKCNKFYIF